MNEPLKLVPIQLAEVGHFKGHGAGPFTLDSKVFDEIVANFNARGLLVPIDWEHASEQEATDGTIPITGAPAQGWIHSIENRGDLGLWGMVEWLEPARTYIKEGKYKYLSPAIRFGARDPVSGKPVGARLTSCACTNSPFLNGLAPLIAAKRREPNAPLVCVVRMTDEEIAATPRYTPGKPLRTMKTPKTLAHSPAEFMPKIKACLDMHDLSTPADVAEKMKALREMHASSNVDGMSGGVDCGAYVDKLRDEMQAPVGSTVEDIFDAVDAMIDAAMAEHETALHPEASAVRADDDQAAAMSAKAAEDHAMSESIALKDVTTKLTAAEEKIAEISLNLKDRENTIVTLKADNERLLKEGKERDAAVIDSRVDDAFETYKDAKKLSADDKDMMRTYCMSNRPGFDKLYPVLRGPKKFILRDLTTPGAGGKDVALTTDAGANPPVAVREVTVAGKPFTLRATASETAIALRDQDHSMGFDDAQELALKLHSGR